MLIRLHLCQRSECLINTVHLQHGKGVCAHLQRGQRDICASANAGKEVCVHSHTQAKSCAFHARSGGVHSNNFVLSSSTFPILYIIAMKCTPLMRSSTFLLSPMDYLATNFCNRPVRKLTCRRGQHVSVAVTLCTPLPISTTPPPLSDEVVAGRERVLRVLVNDLPRQYKDPLNLDYSIYAKDFLFTDPVTTLKSRLMYRGMLTTIGAIALVLFKRGTVEFYLDDCILEDGYNGESGERDGLGRVRTVFRTEGRTRWAEDSVPLFAISGVDYFWLSENDDEGVVIKHHDSRWDQTPAEVKDAFLRRRFKD
jgi:Uncharacterized conserved protein (DUF2358)